MSSVPVLDRADRPCDDDWTDLRSPRAATAEDVRYAIAVSRSRYARDGATAVEIDLSEQSYGGGDAELASDISESVAKYWDQ